MARRMLLAWSLFLLLAANAGAAEQVYQADPVHSGIGFRIRHLYSTFPGRFNRFAARVAGDFSQPLTLRVEAEVEVGSVDTNNEQRDNHLRSADYFAAAERPAARFAGAVTAAGEDGALTVSGQLTLHGVTLPLTIQGRCTGQGPDGRGGQRLGFHGTALLERTAFGVGPAAAEGEGPSLLGTEVELVLDLELAELSEAPPATSAPATPPATPPAQTPPASPAATPAPTPAASPPAGRPFVPLVLLVP